MAGAVNNRTVNHSLTLMMTPAQHPALMRIPARRQGVRIPVVRKLA